MSPSATLSNLGQVRHIPLRYDGSDSQASALKLILTLMPDWDSSDSNVEFVRFTDGITNTLLKAVNRRPGLSKADIDRDSVLLRAYGSGTAVLIDREREAANHELLMRHGLAPELLARFDNGMLYRFVPGTPAQPQDLCKPSVAPAVARRLAEWHARVPCLHDPSPGSNGYTSSNANGNAHGVDATTEATIAKAAAGKPIPNLWTTMQKWILALPKDTKERRERQALLQREFDEMVDRLSQRPGLGHNGVRTQPPFLLASPLCFRASRAPHPVLLPQVPSVVEKETGHVANLWNKPVCSWYLPTVTSCPPMSS